MRSFGVSLTSAVDAATLFPNGNVAALGGASDPFEVNLGACNVKSMNLSFTAASETAVYVRIYNYSGYRGQQYQQANYRSDTGLYVTPNGASQILTPYGAAAAVGDSDPVEVVIGAGGSRSQWFELVNAVAPPVLVASFRVLEDEQLSIDGHCIRCPNGCAIEVVGVAGNAFAFEAAVSIEELRAGASRAYTHPSLTGTAPNRT